MHKVAGFDWAPLGHPNRSMEDGPCCTPADGPHPETTQRPGPAVFGQATVKMASHRRFPGTSDWWENADSAVQELSAESEGPFWWFGHGTRS